MLHDSLQRPLGSLRLSVTDRCNLRCQYCMPAEEYTWLPKADLLSFEEMAELTRAFAALGVDRLRITGGEPLIRQDLPELVALLAGVEGIRDVALTTNGILLPKQAEALRAAGLRRVTVSLDSLNRDRFRMMSGRDSLDKVKAGLEAARQVGFDSLKINTVVIQGQNDDELGALLHYAKQLGAELRFIEYMDVGGATLWADRLVVSRDAILDRLNAEFGSISLLPAEGPAPARRYRLDDGTTFGIIASTTAPFCGTCDRSRLTADGTWYRCLYAKTGTDLRAALRGGMRGAELQEHVAGIWRQRADRGAEERRAATGRGVFAPRTELAADPHLEMHTRGG